MSGKGFVACRCFVFGGSEVEKKMWSVARLAHKGVVS